ncbi:N-acetylneuraminate synthase family protein [Alphaproteobacteria bacterium]|nr:N-acetylneuraminate synthase family protein [Alphaproteobacteria bacterium]
MSIFFIAEIGINHNGSINICKKLIDVAVSAGCDAVKFQKRDIDSVYTQDFLASPRESEWGKTQRDQKLGLEFTNDDYLIIDDYCKNQNINWFASAWDLDSQNFLEKFNLKYNKIASAMMTSKPLLEKVASEKKHTFISTGMCNFDMIDIAVEIFKKHNCSFELMHCRSVYPMNEKDANLRVINTLKKKYSCDVGYSGHEPGLAISYAAAALGISSLERHITLDRSMYGSDQSASIEPQGLAQLVGAVRKIELGLGDGIKTFDDEEKEVALKLRAHI